MNTDGGALGQVLLVDDDPHIRELCCLYLKNAGYTTEEAGDGKIALSKISAKRPDLVVLDVMLPERDGWQVLAEIRKDSIWLPVIMLTAVGDEEDRISGLEMGADDYLTKPFSPRELLARIQAVLRRTSLITLDEHAEMLRFDGLAINPGLRKVMIGSETLTLTPREFELLWFLASHPQQVFSRDQLLDKVWGFDFEGDGRTVDVHITRIRHKLQELEGPEQYLETIWGRGYRFNPGLKPVRNVSQD